MNLILQIIIIVALIFVVIGLIFLSILSLDIINDQRLECMKDCLETKVKTIYQCVC